MAEISLRNYVKEIDNLIENGRQIEQAVQHCRHILKEFPRHVATYRLLGKAFLEKKEYGDSADIFNRVLSAIPDDFIAHIGMAIVREDENNIDDAIWHMERAFEANPANTAIQHELRRLILKRDGLEPQKIRLTRAALARVYSHGELYPQAVAEVHAALKEDPDRVDLQVLLADVHLKSGDLKQAGETSFRILDKLPNCLLANRIAAAFFLDLNKPEEADVFLQRIISMTPYAEFISSPLDDPDSVPASKIQITRIEASDITFTPGKGIEQSDWAASLNPDMVSQSSGGSADDQLPSWLESIDEDSTDRIDIPASDETPSIHPFAGAPTPSDAGIPDWMRDAGWAESNGQTAEGPVHFSDEELEQLENGQIPVDSGLEPANLPGWLQDVSPDSEISEIPGQSESDFPEEGGLPDWLQEIHDGQDVNVEAEGISNQQPSDSFTSLDDASSETEEKLADEQDFKADSEDQLDDIDFDGGASSPAIPSWLEDATPGATETIVTWLGDRTRSEVREPEQKPMIRADETTSNLEPIPAAVDSDVSFSQHEEEGDTEEGQTPEQIQEEKTDPRSGELQDAEQSDSTPLDEDLPDWLDSISNSSDDEDVSEEEVDIPDWIHSMAEQAGEPVPEPPSDKSSGPGWLSSSDGDLSEPSQREDLPDWLTQSTDDLQEYSQAEEEVPDWLEDEPDLETPEESPTRKAPQWISDLSEPSEENLQIEQPPAEPSDLDWLEELVDDVPDELKGVSDSYGSPDWLSGVLDTQASHTTEDIDSLDVEEINWLQEFAEQQTRKEVSQTPDTYVDQSLPSDDLFQTDEIMEEGVEETDWLRKAIRDEAPEESSISTDAPTLVSETQWKESDNSINDQPTIPSNKTVIGRSDSFLTDASPDDQSVTIDDQLEDLPLDDAERLLAEITAMNSTKSAPEDLCATQDELELLKLLKESDSQEFDPPSGFTMEPSEFAPTSDSNASGSIIQPDEMDTSDDKLAPDWLTELATEEGFTDTLEDIKGLVDEIHIAKQTDYTPVSEDDSDAADEPLPPDILERTFKAAAGPVEWLPEEGILEPQDLSDEILDDYEPIDPLADGSFNVEEDEIDLAGFLIHEEELDARIFLDDSHTEQETAGTSAEISSPGKEPATDFDGLMVSEEELESALEWSDYKIHDTAEVSDEQPSSEIDVPAQQELPLSLPHDTLLDSEDFFESLAAVEELEPGADHTAQLSDSTEREVTSQTGRKPVQVPPELLVNGSLESELDSYQEDDQPSDGIEEIGSDSDLFDEIQAEAPVGQNAYEKQPPKDIEYQKTGILVDRDLPQNITEGLEWLSELAAYHEQPVPGTEPGADIKTSIDPTIDRELSLPPSESEDRLLSQTYDTASPESFLDSGNLEEPVRIVDTDTDPGSESELTSDMLHGSDLETEPSVHSLHADTLSSETISETVADKPVQDEAEESEIIQKQRLPRAWKVTLTARKTAAPEDEQTLSPDVPIEEQSHPAEEQAEQLQPETSELSMPPHGTSGNAEPDWLHPAEIDSAVPLSAPEDMIPDWLRTTSSSFSPASTDSNEINATDQAEIIEADAQSESTDSDRGETQAARTSVSPPEPEPAPVAVSKPQLIDMARTALEQENLQEALEKYKKIIKNRDKLDEVINDLRLAIADNPDSPALWQTLGDAYMQNKQPADAVEAYQHGMDVA